MRSWRPRPSSTTSGSIDRKKNMAATQENTRRSKVPRRQKSCWPPRDGRETVIQRVSYLVGHHHTYTDIDGMDYQLLVEADFLVNLFEEGALPETREDVFRRIFRTESGKYLFRQIFSQKTE